MCREIWEDITPVQTTAGRYEKGTLRMPKKKLFSKFKIYIKNKKAGLEKSLIAKKIWKMRKQVKHTGNESVSSNIWKTGVLENIGKMKRRTSKDIVDENLPEVKREKRTYVLH